MLSARQAQLLQIIIEEFIDTAEAVGSLNVSEKYDLDISPATIRNEMAQLAHLGLLRKQHASSGRVPTSDAIRWFLEEVLDEMDNIEAVKAAEAREQMFQKRFNTDHLLQEAVRALSSLTQNTSLAVLDNKRFTSGVSQFIGQPEYADLERLKKIMLLIEDYQAWMDMFVSDQREGNDVKVLVGEETGIDQFANTAVVYAPITAHGAQKGYICVVGPNRMNYREVIPSVKYVVRSITDAVEGW